MPIDCLCAGIVFADVACAPVDRVPAAGELVRTERMQLGLGGCASNTALDLAKLGVEVGLAGCVGDDPFGDYLAQALSVDHINTAGLRRLPNTGSACSMIINVAGQDRRFISTAGANTQFTVEHLPSEWIEQAKVLYIGGYFMMPGLETEAMVDVFRRARQAGVKTVLDVVLYDRSGYWEALAPLLPVTDVFLPNDHEAAAITGLSNPLAQAQRFRDAGADTVVITLGAEGSLLVAPELKVRSGVYPVEFVGGAGSGDAFDAGYIMGLLQGEDPIGCLRWGSALGASCVRAIGTTDTIFTRAEAEAFMRQHPLRIEEAR